MTKKALEITKACAVVWQNVEYLKDAKGIGDAELARAINRSTSTLTNRRSHPKNTTLEDLIKLGKYFGVEPASLLLPLIPQLAKAIGEEYESEGN